MAVSLSKGQKISLSKEAGKELTEVFMGLGWDTLTETKGGLFGFGARTVSTPVDLDASCVMFDDAGNHLDSVWFRQLKSKDGSVIHTGDNRSGAGAGDDEQIRVKLDRVPPAIKTLVFVVNCFSNVDFSKVKNAYCRLVDETSQKEVEKFDLSCSGAHTAMILAKVYRHEGDWKMHAIGDTAEGRTTDKILPAIKAIL